MKLLANDGLAANGVKLLEEAGFEVITDTVPQEELLAYINNNDIAGLLVRSATKVRKDLIDACPGLQLIARGGVGMDNIDVAYARSIGRKVINTPKASSQSVAELVMAHMFGMARFAYDSNRQMPASGSTNFKDLKKQYSKGRELRGKTLGIVGFGGIGRALAEYGLGNGMKVIAYDSFVRETVVDISLRIEGAGAVKVAVNMVNASTLFQESDFISWHIPMPEDGKAVISTKQFNEMKDGVCIVNTARGGVIDEEALIAALDAGKVGHAALDVFVGEPAPKTLLLTHPKVSLTPHIGGSTVEAQGRIAIELAESICDFFAQKV